MAIHLISCIFPMLCPAFEPCENKLEGETVNLKFRMQDDVPIVEFWTPGSPQHMPWPAIVQTHSLPQISWVFFSSGEIHGSWMVTVPTGGGDAFVSVHSQAVFAQNSMYASKGACEIQQEGV
ncbi:hypothetical protein [Ruegeria sp. MALMAid1280]|uniref:hypothetical protein n=1 Tax=Ruegeria sp. MALMAid1280 TaxID=3411634 RepID=UPI003BA02F20